MGYTPHTWVEYQGTGAQKAGWMNLLETQYDEMVTYLTVTTTHSERYYGEATCDAKYFGPTTDGTGSGFVAAMVDGITGDGLIAQMIPTGVIAVWYGAIVDIPSGWHICDGTGGTIDLRNKFPMAAGTTYTQGTTGGASQVNSTGTVTIATHAVTISELPSHTHSFTDYNETSVYGNLRGVSTSYVNGAVTVHVSTSGSTGGGNAHGHSGSTLDTGSAGNNMPPYKAYAYIQKV
jgi:hypothetical protein